MKNSVTVLFFGTSEFAISSLERLVESRYLVVGVVTKPDEPAGRKLELTPPPVKIWATKNNIPVWQPVELGVGSWELGELPEADIFIVCAYGKIIPKKIIEMPRYGTLNIHPSLLPRWRGPSPIQYAILNGDTETGVTIIKVDELLDHGDAIAAFRFQLSAFGKITYPELRDALAREGAKLLIETLPRWIAGEITPVPQNEAQAMWSHKITKDDGRINWQKPAEEIERAVRAFTPWPGAWTMWHDGDVPKRIRIDKVDLDARDSSKLIPGFVWQDEQKNLLIQAGSGSLAIKKLTREGKKSMDAASFIRGYADIVDSILL